MRQAVGIMAAMLIVGGTPVWAARTGVHDAAESDEYGRKAGGMIGRGVLNISTCFVDVLVNVVNETKAGPPLVGTLTGVARGTGCGILRLGSGAVDLVTFWVPGFNGFPVSDSYENCVAPVSASASAEPAPPSGHEPVVSSWEVPAAEPGAAQAPAATGSEPGQSAQRTWKK